MTWQADHDRDEDIVLSEPAQGSWLGAAAAISVLIVATITLTLVVGDIGIASFQLP